MLLVFASLDVTPVHAVVVVVTLVLAAAVVAVNAILFVEDEVLFPRAPAPTPTAAFAVVALFLS